MYSNKGVFHSDNGSSGHGSIVIDFQPFTTKLHEYLALYQYPGQKLNMLLKILDLGNSVNCLDGVIKDVP